MSLEEKLAKIKSPNLQSQQHTVVVLSSIEDTLREQRTKATPTAYFAALLALLKQSASSEQENAPNEIITSTVYLLDLITEHVPPTLLRTQFAAITSLLAPYLTSDAGDAPLIKSTIGCVESVLVAQDATAWNLPQNQLGPRQVVAAFLTLSLDIRPKVRKRAQDALRKVLQNPPPGPSIDHPAAELCAVAAQNNLKNAVQLVHQSRKQQRGTQDSNDPVVVRALQLTKTVATASGGWPSKNIEALCEILLSISRSRNDYLVMGAFEIFEVIFDGMQQDEVSSSKLPRLLDAIVELRPAQNDSQLIPPWIAILSSGYGAFAQVEPEDTFAKVPELLDLVSVYLASSAHNIRVSASECLISFFANCIPKSVVVEPSIYDEKVLQQIADRALGLLAVKYQSAWMEVFNTTSALLDAMRWRGDPYLLAIVKSTGDLRGNEAFQGKKEADEVLSHAIRNLGPQAVLTVLPLNLIKPKPKQLGRAWMLPLLRDHVSNTTLSHFKSEMIPLSEAMHQRVMNHGAAEKTMEIKIYETVVHQVWSSLPGYCDLPLDLTQAFDQNFAEQLSNIMYSQTDLRVDLCRGLQNLVESNRALLESEVSDAELQVERRVSRADARANLDHLAGFASNLLAVLFNVYSQTLPQSRAFILQCINAYLSITPPAGVEETFDRVVKMLESELPAADKPAGPKKPQQQQSNSKLPPTSHTLIDLVISSSIYLPRARFPDLFTLAFHILTNPTILSSDQQLIKKVYKVIPRLATSEQGIEALKDRNSELRELMLSVADKTPVPARRDRLVAIATLTTFLPDTDLHFIPAVLSEVVLACKDTNEKARNAGFDVLLQMASKISDASPGITIRNSLVSHMPDDAPDAPATLEEVFTMVSAGLAGVAPHMIAASITALGRLLFDYHSDNRLSDDFKEQLVDTVTMFLQSNNREIVRAVMGFIKVMVVVLPISLLEPRMAGIVPSLMGSGNKGRLRAKVKGILDRLIRRFGGAKVEQWVGPEGRKLVVNIRKARERARRKKKGGAQDDDDDDAGSDGDANAEADGKYDNEYDEAVYGSDDDDDSEVDGGSDDDAMSGVTFKTGKTSNKTSGSTTATAARRRQKNQFIRQDEDDDEPLDLLDPKSMANISSSRAPRQLRSQDFNLAGQRKTKARVNEDGKLVFADDVLGKSKGNSGRNTTGSHDDAEMNEAEQGNAINAYLDAVDGPDAVRRGQKGRLKVKSGMQKTVRRDTSATDGDADGMDLDVEEARQVARAIMSGSSSPGGKSGNSKTNGNGRRGLGIEKNQAGGGHQRSGSTGGRGSGGGGGGSKIRNKAGPGQRGMRFSSHPARKSTTPKGPSRR